MGSSYKGRFKFADLKLALGQWRRLAPFVLQYWPRLAYFFLGTLLLSGGNACRAFVIKPFFEFVTKSNKGEATAHAEQSFADMMSSHGVVVLAGMLLVAGVAMAFGTWVKEYNMAWLTQRATIDVQRQLAASLLRQPVSFFNTNRKGELMSRVTNDLGGVNKTYSILFGDFVQHPVMIVTLLIAAIYTSPALSLASLAVPLVLIPVIAFTGRIRKWAGRSLESLAELTNFFQQFFDGVRVIKAYGMESRQVESLNRTALEYFKNTRKVGLYKGMSRAAVEIVLAIVLSSCLLGGVWLLSTPLLGTKIEIGTLFQFLALLAMLYDPVRRFSHTLNNMNEAMVANSRVFELMDREPDLKDAPDAVPAKPFSRDIVFENVGFEYLAGRPVLQEINFSAAKGTMTALVGSTGAGKSTLMDLIPRFYAPTSGRILVDGVDITRLKGASWLEQVAVVAQDTFLFNTTVRDNLLAARGNATSEELLEALRAANIDEEILSLPQGLDTPLGDRGVNLSGGQRQRLAIARAFVKRAPVLLLDEATSALDTETERKVQSALDTLIKGATVFAIAHRLSTIVHAHQILVMDGGRIIERGTHKELMAANGRYALLYHTQIKTASQRRDAAPGEADGARAAPAGAASHD